MRLHANARLYSKLAMSLRLTAGAGAVLASVLMAGCGSGGGDSAPPAVANAVVTTNPTPLTYLGGAGTVSVAVTDTTAVDPATVKIDILNSSNVSVIGGPQLMTHAANPANTYTYPVTLPNNITGTSNLVYSMRVTAADTIGNLTPAPVQVGTISIPAPPGPPNGP
jgi:hypothetical protein